MWNSAMSLFAIDSINRQAESVNQNHHILISIVTLYYWLLYSQ
jgi:hypothetical protein